ncbi:type IV pilin [Haloarcula amylovorans]|uniref:type IV pilin n=1 Tax=Haloarcula amylovorans TaxID=2562280 RepID=UPI0010761600|nr:type IV pilin N-terminal domain-containing protein [Halomicroarcula amylolytica]
MDIKQLINDDDAVSPVIGVILMVAITVILAAVIASFVLGLGDQAQQTTPQASFSFDYEKDSGASNDGYLDITHDGGDSISTEEVYIRGSGVNTTDKWSNIGSSTATSGEVKAGNSLTLDASNDYDIRVVYESQEGDNSATLSKDSGPQA